MRFKVIFLTLFFLAASMAFAYEEVKNLTLSAEGIERLEIDCGAGFLKVYGHEGLANIEVEAEIVVKGKSERSAVKFIRDKLELSLERRGSRAVLISKFKHDFSILSLGSKHINLTVNMPEGMDLKVDDGSGSIHVWSVGKDVTLSDGSGSIHIDGVEGDVTIEDDGSGGVNIKNVKGKVRR